MSGPATRGWCPSLFEPMASGDGLLVRVKPHARGLTADQARVVAAAAERCGSGRIEVTNRANLQIRGLSAASAPVFAQAMVEAGLASPTQEAERRRNLLIPIDATARAMDLAAQMEQWLETDDALVPLPGKFGFAIVAGAEGRDEPTADILVALGEETPVVFLAGASLAAAVEDPLAAARALAHAFLDLAAKASPAARRMKALTAGIGAPAVFARAGLRAEPATRPPPPAPGPSVGAAAGSFGLGLPFGAADAPMLRAAADLADRFGDGRIRTTSARALVLTGVGPDARALGEAAARAGFIVDPADPRLRIAACAGRPACASAAVDVRAVASGLAAIWRDPGVLHVSGCAKGCAHPDAACVTLVATANPGGYDMILNGRAGDRPHRARLSLAEAALLITDRGPHPA
jgi:precorrin-3B synthase